MAMSEESMQAAVANAASPQSPGVAAPGQTSAEYAEAAGGAEAATEGPERPPGNASRDDWAAYAETLGIADEGQTRAEFIAAVDAL